MRFAGNGSAYEDHVAPRVQERARGELANPVFINRRVGEDELGNILASVSLAHANVPKREVSTGNLAPLMR